MMPLEPVTLSFGTVILLGLVFGSGPCSIVCLPYLGPVFVSTGETIGRAWRILLPFSLGRITGYSLLGAIAGQVGLMVQDWLATPWVRWILGGATILVALSLLFRLRRRNGSVDAVTTGSQQVTLKGRDAIEPLLPGSLYLMGLGMALNPCTPLTLVILAAATTASVVSGSALGFGFGLGAVAVPAIIFAFGIAHFGRQLRQHLNRWRGILETTSIGLLLLMGAGTALGWINL